MGHLKKGKCVLRGHTDSVFELDRPHNWAWEYPTTGRRKSMFLSTEKFPTQVAVERHLEAFVLKLNSDNPTPAILEPNLRRHS
jgi:hypothetical protein